jgi:nuclear transport factor 2 (NTF2) superfamily protein
MPSTGTAVQTQLTACRDPKIIAQVYTADSIWRNRSSFISGTAAIEQLLTDKWAKEKSYRLRKELFAFTDNKIAPVRPLTKPGMNIRMRTTA